MTLSARGELERLFWPHVDRDQHLGELRLGLSDGGSTLWLDEEPFSWEQRYEDDASILHTRVSDGARTVELTDLVTPVEPVLVRRVRCDSPGLRLVVHCRPELGEGRRYFAAYVDPGAGALVFYRRNVALAIAVRGGAEATVSSVDRGEDGDGTIAHRSPVAGVLEAGLEREACVALSFGSSPAEAVAGLEPLERDFASLEQDRRRHDLAQLALAAPLEAEPELTRLYRRSRSLLGLAWPFRAVDPGGTRMRATAAAIERELVLPCGGVLRHEGDDYAGGNPWLLTTLWLGLYYRQIGDEAGLQRCLDYALSRRTELDLLPEQADRDGKPAWVLPLAWSHAMLVLAARPELKRDADPRSSYPAQTLITGR